MDSQLFPAVTTCCEKHDICYDKCNTDKSKCDTDFQTCLRMICKNLHKATGGAELYEGKEDWFSDFLCECFCLSLSLIFYTGFNEYRRTKLQIKNKDKLFLICCFIYIYIYIYIILFDSSF